MSPVVAAPIIPPLPPASPPRRLDTSRHRRRGPATATAARPAASPASQSAVRRLIVTRGPLGSVFTTALSLSAYRAVAASVRPGQALELPAQPALRRSPVAERSALDHDPGRKQQATAQRQLLPGRRVDVQRRQLERILLGQPPQDAPGVVAVVALRPGEQGDADHEVLARPLRMSETRLDTGRY